jgi:phage shock protein PspC (stress-responsive transcriptional regulator)
MKETIKINLNGQLFDLDTDAYTQLKKYLDSLKTKFSSSPNEAQEILEDIESRIAEILQQKISVSKQVISMADIDEIISLMGTADEMDQPVTDEEKKTDTSNSQPKSSKRFYRDPQNKILGGVCAGIAAYFNIDPLWIRLLFVFLVFANLAGLLIYIILLIILPPAITTGQRLEMQGKRVTINDIEGSVKREFEKVKASVKDIPNSKGYRNAESAVSEIFNTLGHIIIVFLKVIGVIIAVSLLMALIFTVLGLIIGGAAIIPFHFANALHFPNLLAWPQISFLGFCLFLVIVLPILALLTKIIKLLFDIRTTNRVAAGIGATIWVVAFISIIVLLVTDTNKDIFRLSKTSTHTILIQKEKPLYIGLKTRHIDEDDIDYYHVFNFEFAYDDFHDSFLKNPTLEFKESANKEMKLVIERNYANLKIGKMPKDHNRIVEYSWQMTDTLLLLDEYYSCDEDNAWRFPDVKIILEIPEGQKVFLKKDIGKLAGTFYNDDVLMEMKHNKLQMVND